jgi:glycosyltransferase involved in cell wall biosynthesis
MKLALQIVRRVVPGEWGGIETVVINTARRLPTFGFSASVLATRALASSDHDDVFGVPVRRFDYFYPVLGLTQAERLALDAKGGNPVSMPLYRALLSWPDPAVVHVHTAGRLAGIARSAARRRGIPYVVTLHGGHFTTPPEEAAAMARQTRGRLDYGRVFGLVFGARRFLRDAAAVMCVSREECVAARRRLPGQRVLHVPNGVNVQSLEGGDGRRFRAAHDLGTSRVVLCVARIDYQKNQVALVRALPRIREAIPSAVCVFVGPVTVPAYGDLIRSEAERAGVMGAVRFVGPLPPESPALADAYAAADVFVLPSIHEPFGIVVLEAWSATKPVVVSRVGGLVDLIEDGQTGLMADPHEPRSFADAVTRLLGDGPFAAGLARAGREKVESFGWQSTTSRIAEVYESVLEQSHRGSHHGDHRPVAGMVTGERR